MGALLLHLFGLDGNQSSTPYMFWSGVGSDLSELAIVGSLAALIAHRTCHVHRCVRLGRYPIAGTSWTVCGRHHPAGPPTAADVAAAVNPDSTGGAP